MALVVCDGEGQCRILSFAISPSHSTEDWLRIFNKTSHLCRRSTRAIIHCDGESAIKTAFYMSEVCESIINHYINTTTNP